MKISAVIAEYNPLHRGHLLHLAHAKTLGDCLVVVQNGDFCQRGEDSVLDMYTRARHAILAGADLVVQLPTVFGVNCADKFAFGGTRMLAALPHPVILSFGSECGNIDVLQNTATLLADEPITVQQQIKDLLSQGIAYPTARATAIGDYARSHQIEICDLSRPNNILALEYIRHGKELTFDTIMREDNYKSVQNTYSSTAVREAMHRHEEVSTMVPPYVSTDLASATEAQSVLYLAAIRSLTKEIQLYDAGEGLQNRVYQAAQNADTFEQALQQAGTKRYTTSRLRRLFTYSLLGITQDLAKACVAQDPYYNVLAVKRSRTDLLGMLSRAGNVYTSIAQLQGQSEELDARAHSIYRTLHQNNIPNVMQIVD